MPNMIRRQKSQHLRSNNPLKLILQPFFLYLDETENMMFINIQILVQIVFWSKSNLSNSFFFIIIYIILFVIFFIYFSLEEWLYFYITKAMKTGTIKHHIGFKQSLFQDSLPTPNPNNLHNHWSLPFLCSGTVCSFNMSLVSLFHLKCLYWCLLEEDGEVCCVGPRERNRKCQELLQAQCLSVADDSVQRG